MPWLNMDNVMKFYEYDVTLQRKVDRVSFDAEGNVVEDDETAITIKGKIEGFSARERKLQVEGTYPHLTAKLHVRSSHLANDFDPAIDIQLEDVIVWNNERYVIKSEEGKEFWSGMLVFGLSKEPTDESERRR